MPNIPRALIRLRVLLAISQVKFGNEIGYTSANIQMIEAGKCRLSPRLLSAIQKRYGIDLYVYAWALDRQERFGMEIVAAMEAAVLQKRWQRNDNSNIRPDGVLRFDVSPIHVTIRRQRKTVRDGLANCRRS